MSKVNKWIQKAHPKAGALSKQLGIPVKDNIPMKVLTTIVHAQKGEKVHIDHKTITVTHLLKKRANMAVNLKRLHG